MVRLWGVTASAVNFADGTQFSATAPQTTPLLSVSVPLGLQFGRTAGSILNQSQATNSSGQVVGLQVQPGVTLALIGGEVRLDGGNLQSPGGRVELGGLAGAGTVGLRINDNNLRLSYPTVGRQADVSLTNGAIVNVASSGGGSIAVNARNLSISENSRIVAGILPGVGTVDSQTGNITLNATGTLEIGERSRISNIVFTNALGNSGDIRIQAGSLFLTDGARLSTTLFGQGNVGDVIIEARDQVILDNGAIIFSNVEEAGNGKGGNIRISTGALSVANGAALSTNISGQGDAGDILIDARDQVSLGSDVRILNGVQEDGIGNGGTIRISTGLLSATNDAFMAAFTFGQGNAGNILIDARDQVSLDNGANINNFGDLSNGGDIRISTGSLSVTNDAQLNATTFGQGDAGEILIDARNQVVLDNSAGIFNQVGELATGNGGDIRISTGSLRASNLGLLQAITEGRGNVGSIIINARDRVVFEGGTESTLRSGAQSLVGSGAVANSGNVEITTGSLVMLNRAGLIASTYGQGTPGNVIINARENVSLDNSSTIFSIVDENAEGRGGNINITTGSLLLTNGGQLDASTFGQGNSGNIIVTARDTISLDGISPYDRTAASTLFTEVVKGAVGDGGNIQISTGSLLVTNEGQLDARTQGRGNAGSIFITARDTVLFDGTSVTGERSARALSRVNQGAVGSGGNIEITTRSLTVNNGARLLASTDGQGDAGNVIINARDSVTFDGSRTDADGPTTSAALSSVEEDGVGNGGNVQIAARSLSVTNSAQLNAESRGQGDAGNLDITADSIRLSNQASLSANTTAGQGNIFLRSRNLVLRRGSNITTNAIGTATGGNITLDTDVLAALENSDISANAEESFGGRIIINAQGIFGSEFRNQLTPLSDITTSSNLGPKFSGTVEINTPDVDPDQGLVALPTELVDASGLIASGCGSGGRQGSSKFIVTGRGGLPYRPIDGDISPYPTGTVRSIPSSGPSSETPISSVEASVHSTNSTTTAPTQIVEARGWVINALGQVVLTASAPTVKPHIPSMTAANCHPPKTSS